MTCHHFDLGNGVTGVVCRRGHRAKRCSVPGCGRPAERECDFALTGRASGKTCDKALCAAHAHHHGEHVEGEHKGDRIDYCPGHHEVALKRAEQRELAL